MFRRRPDARRLTTRVKNRPFAIDRRLSHEMLERRELLAGDIDLLARPILAPGSDPALVHSLEGLDFRGGSAQGITGASGQGGTGGQGNPGGTAGNLGGGSNQSGGISLGGARWERTAVDTSPSQGDGVTITWSIVPDGTMIAAGGGGQGASNLIAFMDGIYGNGGAADTPLEDKPWFDLYVRIFDNWSARTGLNYVYVADDGLNQSNAAIGEEGLRGDVRIGGANIDGNGNILAFNFFPTGRGNNGFDGDMTIDTADNFYANAADDADGENRGLINILSHEAGHGIGLGHVHPINETKIMEPFLTEAFLGPQNDDILAAHTLYGDRFRDNDTPAGATPLPDFADSTATVTDLSIDNGNDVDWFSFDAAGGTLVSFTIDPIGEAYQIGPQPGAGQAERLFDFDSRRLSDLRFEIYNPDGTLLVAVNETGLGESESVSDIRLTQSGLHTVLVLGDPIDLGDPTTDFFASERTNTQLYDITATSVLPSLSLAASATRISELGGVTELTVTRLFADSNVALPVTIQIADTTELNGPTSVEIPAGETSVTFTVRAVDDLLLDGTQSVLVRAIAPGVGENEVTIDVEDFEPLAIAVTPREISENRGVAELVITRTDTSITQSIRLTSSDTTEATVPATVVFPVGVRTQRVPVLAVDDAILDGSQFVILRASADGMEDAATSVTVTDFEALRLNIADDAVISEARGTFTATVTRTDPNGRLTALLTASPPGQISVPTSVQFLPGELTSLPFEIVGVDNNLLDGTRTASVTAVASGYQPATGNITITDAEALRLQFARDTISERGGETTVRVVRTDPRGALTATLATVPSDDFDADNQFSFSSVVTFADGQAFSAPITLTAMDNDFLDGTRTVSLTATAEPYTRAIGSVDVTDFEALTIEIVDAGGVLVPLNQIAESGMPANIRVTLPSPRLESQGPLVVSLASGNFAELAIPATITIPVGRATAVAPLIPRDNGLVDGNRTITASASAALYESATAEVVIVNEDEPVLASEWEIPTFDQVRGQISERNGETVLTLTRNTINQATVEVTASPAGAVTVPESVVFAAGQLTLDIPVDAVDNRFADGDRMVTISLRSTVHDPIEIDLRLTDDDIAGVTLTDANGQPTQPRLTANERDAASGQTATRTFSVRLAAAPLTPVRLAVNTPDRLSASRSTLSFDASNWDLPQDVRVDVIDDVIVQDDQTLNITLSPIANLSDPMFAALPSQVIPIVVASDDVAGLELTASDDSTFASELGMDDSFQVRLSARPTGPVTLQIDNSEIPSLAVSPSNVSFTPDNWNLPQTVTISTELDFDADGSDLGLLRINVSAGTTAFGFATLPSYAISVVQVDAELADLRLRASGSNVQLIDITSDQTLRTVPISGGVLRTGNRSETIRVDESLGLGTVTIDTADGDDTLLFDSASRVEFIGGDGRDTLKLVVDGMTLDFQSLASLNAATFVQPRQIEVIDTLENGTQTLIVNPAAVRAMTDNNNELLLRVDGPDELRLGNEWTPGTPEIVDNAAVHVLRSGDATLRLFGSAIFQNPVDPGDVDLSGDITALDALLIINFLNQSDGRALSGESTAELLSTMRRTGQTRFYDVSGDNTISALDALQVINAINARESMPASGESIAPASPVAVRSAFIAPPVATESKFAIERVREVTASTLHPDESIDTAMAQFESVQAFTPSIDWLDDRAGDEDDAEESVLDGIMANLT